MSWFSFLKKSKQESTSERSALFAQVEEPPVKSRGRSKVKDDQSDPALPEKKRARRRLVGAVAMTLALVIVLPMVLDSEPKPVSEDVVIHIPSKNKVSKLSASGPSVEEAASTPTPAEVAPPENQTNGTGTVAATTAATAAVATAATTVTSTAAKAAPETGKTTAAVEKNGDAKPAAPAPKSKVMIQVAALASKDKVKELRARLTKAGFKSQTQKVATDDGERIRVRVGPYTSKKEAEKQCPKLSKMKLKCTLVSN